MPTIKTKSANLYYADHRKTDQTPLLLIHGAGGTHLDWPAQLRRLPDVIALDLPGHGKSAIPSRTSIEDFAADIVALLDALEIRQAILVGHSMGGAIAQMTALVQPGRVAGLVLVGTGAKLRVHPDILDRVLTDQRGVATMLKDWLWAKATPDEMREAGFERLMSIPEAVVHGDYFACDHFDIRERLPEIEAPTLVIGGTADQMTPPKFSIYLQENLPNAELVTVAGGGHMMALEQPDVVTEAIRRWLEKVR